MNIHSTTSNYFRATAHVGIRQKIARRRVFDVPGGILLWKAVGKILLWSLPLVLAANLWCSSAIDSKRIQYEAVEQALVQLENSSTELKLRKTRLLSPVRVKIAAAEKLSLFEPAPGQIQRM